MATTPVACRIWTGDKLTDLIMLDHEGYLAMFERASGGTNNLCSCRRDGCCATRRANPCG